MDSHRNPAHPTTGGEYHEGKPSGKPDHSTGHRQPSPGDLLSSAKVIAEAAKMTAGRETDKVDKAKVASATEDVLIAAKHYGKLGETGVGKYVQKAETYLHEYHTSRPASGPIHGDSVTGGVHSQSTGQHAPSGVHPTSTHQGKQEEEGGSGIGDYAKLAQGFLKKPGHEGQTEGGSGFGDYMKLAQGFLKKN